MRFERVVLAAAAALALSACSGSVLEQDVASSGLPEPSRPEDRLDRISKEALERGIASGRLADNQVIYSVVLADDAARFESGRFQLTPKVRQQLAALVEQLRAENRKAYLEIQGHTDSVGPAETNRKLGLRRAEAVRRFLARQGLKADQMATISYGEDAPVAPNADPAGRAENRRVVIVVLS